MSSNKGKNASGVTICAGIFLLRFHGVKMDGSLFVTSHASYFTVVNHFRQRSRTDSPEKAQKTANDDKNHHMEQE